MINLPDLVLIKAVFEKVFSSFELMYIRMQVYPLFNFQMGHFMLIDVIFLRVIVILTKFVENYNRLFTDNSGNYQVILHLS